ncbi:SGNH/GDSL hydrolase family protein [Actinacidiphila paucisporea]|uniref:Acyl-CoA thioesterase-1 n=1 Tax=Actinacidiphila paucisporea TaxID=310782 RepID=A0A1M7QW27_9ACTN|nr:GDSL-type esterase/lipase family protein [Actinacidiphila paucisporea]SHN35989.1 acyl-CoA thioesterase-1 [Actinacidiphila paucisporea]
MNPPSDPGGRARNAQAERLVRYMHPDRSTPYLIGAGAPQLAAALGLAEDVYLRHVDALDGRARAAAAEVLAEPAFAALVNRLPFEPGTTILAVGESDTADRLSWLDVLRHVLWLRQPGQDAVTVVNAAVSGQTTTEALARWTAVLRAAGPVDWILCKLGANDARRIDDRATLVGPDETARNLSILRGLARPNGARWVWLTPHRVDEERITAAPGFRFTGSRWLNADLAAVSKDLRSRPEPLVDLDPVFVPAERPGLLEPDGLHPASEGQRVILTALVQALVDGAVSDG